MTVTLIDPAVVDHRETEVSGSAQSREVRRALNTETVTVISETVADASGNTGSPIGRLGVPWVTQLTEVDSEDVALAIGNSLETSVADKDGRRGALGTNGHKG